MSAFSEEQTTLEGIALQGTEPLITLLGGNDLSRTVFSQVSALIVAAQIYQRITGDKHIQLQLCLVVYPERNLLHAGITLNGVGTDTVVC